MLKKVKLNISQYFELDLLDELLAKRQVVPKLVDAYPELFI